jgi:hypothetical protein
MNQPAIVMLGVLKSVALLALVMQCTEIGHCADNFVSRVARPDATSPTSLKRAREEMLYA